MANSGKGKGARSGLWMAAVALCATALVAPRFGVATNAGTLLSDHGDALIESLEFARALARQQGADVLISASGGDWSRGWIVWNDKDGDGIAAATEIRYRATPLPEPLTLASATGSDLLRYAPSGLVERADELALCAGGGAGLRISISALGNLFTTRCRCG